ncbi:MAG: hypothetical protein MUF84_16850 [Anaerolineae bacterium]|nr:hypothetical protein [Anaerolineae bacterium]
MVTLLKKEVELVALWQRLRDTYGYRGSYSAVRRFVAHHVNLRKSLAYPLESGHARPQNEWRWWVARDSTLAQPPIGHLDGLSRK